ncbi:hypothetical protein B0T22DRAFT_443753 [Podospora appendiculata]|uniref:Aminoglycoside phosphotransferase domain-containing protein n=1 Tax=Podospora appendiculata TaxID=314037 RepID=A0AAE0X2Y5_9PEZI|nr:hypothetical protein B0T22DRAFT_443753 [Podospora appendiculata]
MSMEVGGMCDSEYRIRAGDKVRYAVIAPNTFPRDVLSCPLGSFPPLPWRRDDRTVVHISRDPTTKELQSTLSNQKLPGVPSGEKTRTLSAAAYECRSVRDHRPGSPSNGSQTMVAKIARFEWEVPRIVSETRAYKLLDGSGVAPRFLGHIHEHGRVIGFLLEKVEDVRRAGPGDLLRCQDALRVFHRLTGVAHGDMNRHNFLVASDNGEDRVWLIDFERSSCVPDETENPARLKEEMMRREMEQLHGQLAEETGRGGGFEQESSPP